MNLRVLKRWHWVAVGLAAGALVGGIRAMWDAQQSVGGPGFITQKLFEAALQAPPSSGHPYVANIVIHSCPSADGIDLASVEAFDADAGRYRNYFFAAPRPFVTVTSNSPHEYGSVVDYLNELAVANPSLRPRFAWWDAAWATMGFYLLVGGAVIGGLWPTLLRLIDGPAPKDPAYDLERFHHEAGDDKAVVSEAEEQRFRELEEEMERNLQGSGADAPAAQVAAPIRKLDGDQLEAPLSAPHDEKDFAGEFYPVEKKHGPHGFSLVELIVVIGIVMLLVAFAMPAMRYARMSAQTVKCAAQLREIGQALHAYASENHGSLPAWSDWHTWPPDIDGDTFGPAWTIELIPYIGKPDSPVYNCPSFPLPGKYRNYFLETQWCGRSGRSAMKLTDITLSGRFVLSGDTTNMSHYPADPKLDDADPDDFGGGMLLWPWTGGSYMHLGGNNVLFDDGHVSLCSRFNPTEMTFNPHRVQNHDNVTPD